MRKIHCELWKDENGNISSVVNAGDTIGKPTTDGEIICALVDFATKLLSNADTMKKAHYAKLKLRKLNEKDIRKAK